MHVFTNVKSKRNLKSARSSVPIEAQGRPFHSRFC